MKKLDGKVAVITGGNSGIGLATAKRFVAEGAKVAVVGRNQGSLDSTVKLLGKSAIAIQADVAKPSDMTKAFAKVSEHFGKIDILMANAGVYVLGPVGDFAEDAFDKVVNINFKGVFFSVQKALPHMNDGGSIILVSSTVSQKGVPGHSAYAATKAAVRSMARSFSADLLSRKIRVNSLSPGPTDTPVLSTVTSSAEEAKAMGEAMANFTPVKRLGTAEEIAGAATYLASDESAYMLGTDVLVDGGLRDM